MNSELTPLRKVKFTTTGEHEFFVNDAEYELLKNDPHTILVEPSSMENYVTRVVHVTAMQLTKTNMWEAAEKSGGRLEWNATLKRFVLILDAPNRNGVISGHPGMWLVSNGKGYVVMTDANFQRKYVKEEDPGGDGY